MIVNAVTVMVAVIVNAVTVMVTVIVNAVTVKVNAVTKLSLKPHLSLAF